MADHDVKCVDDALAQGPGDYVLPDATLVEDYRDIEVDLDYVAYTDEELASLLAGGH